MNAFKLLDLWRSEEKTAHIHGWDFSHLAGRFTEETDLPWDYGSLARSRLRPTDRLLDLDTGGGEFLLELCHPYALTSATEAYPPNTALCRTVLTPLGIDFRETDAAGPLPFADASFDIVLNRHGRYCISELHRILKPGGLFLTQQVGEDNDRELVELLLPGTAKPFPGMNLAEQRACFAAQGFTVLRGEEAFRPIRFFDVGALVWFARVIPWEFPGFSVDACLDRLLYAQRLLETRGSVDGTIHRYLIEAQR